MRNGNTMAKIRIDDREYDVDAFSSEAKGRLDMLVATENRIRDLQREIAILQTARNAYMAALKELLPPPSAPAAAG